MTPGMKMYKHYLQLCYNSFTGTNMMMNIKSNTLYCTSKFAASQNHCNCIQTYIDIGQETTGEKKQARKYQRETNTERITKGKKTIEGRIKKNKNKIKTNTNAGLEKAQAWR